MRMLLRCHIRNGRPVLWASRAMLIVLGWQALTATANYHGNWTAFFCTGSLREIPPQLKAESIYTFPGSRGYDGQFYHYMAHDPFRQRNFARYIDEPGLRYRRILVPLMAWTIAAGRDQLVDFAYYTVVLASVFLGTYCLAVYAQVHGRHPGCGLLFLFSPAVLISVDRMLVDSTLAAFTAAFLIASNRPRSWRFWLVLAGAALTRETGILLAFASGATAILRERRRSVLILSALTPCAAWYLFAYRHNPPFAYYPSHVLFASLISAALHPTQYAADIPFAWAIQLGDVVALVGATLAVTFGLAYSRFGRVEAPTVAALLFAALAALVQPGDLWVHLGRIISPLLLILTSAWIRSGRVLLMAPTLLILPRVLMQFGKQVYGILHFSWL